MGKKAASKKSTPRATQIRSKIAGVTQGNRQTLVRCLKPGQELLLEREPTNENDSNAVAIWARVGWFGTRKKIGYIGSNLAEDIAGHIDVGRDVTATVLEVTGGGGMLWWKKYYGVNIAINVD